MTNSMTISAQPIVWREPRPWWSAVAVALLVLGAAFFEGLRFLTHMWGSSEEYSYGYMVPVITLFLIWHKRDALRQVEFVGSWYGVALLLAGVAMLVAGELATLYIIVQYGFLLAVAGTALAGLGGRAFRIILAPLIILAFMIPLPNFLYQGLSASLQLISSDLGVAVIRAFGISVTAEGNVIDLGTFRLQVVEACNGLRYLFPLMTFGFIAAYLFKAPMWQRALVFLSTIPITVFMNSFRIGVIGVTVEHWGPEMAEGFLHDFEGWIVFMACTGVLFLEIWLLARVTQPGVPFKDVFGLEPGSPAPAHSAVRYRAIPRPLLAAIGILMAVAAYSQSMPERIELAPSRTEFVAFPLQLGEWRGTGDRMDKIYVDALKFDDYVMANYVDGQPGEPVNFYSAYYGSQRKGQSVHSPRSCIPGDGWQIEDHSTVTLDATASNGTPLAVNRVLIRKGDHHQLVYYWFQQRGRDITNEYLVKWYIFWDAITRDRSDGALVRLSVAVPPGGDPQDADARLQRFTRAVLPQLSQYIPD